MPALRLQPADAHVADVLVQQVQRIGNRAQKDEGLPTQPREAIVEQKHESDCNDERHHRRCMSPDERRSDRCRRHHRHARSIPATQLKGTLSEHAHAEERYPWTDQRLGHIRGQRDMQDVLCKLQQQRKRKPRAEDGYQESLRPREEQHCDPEVEQQLNGQGPVGTIDMRHAYELLEHRQVDQRIGQAHRTARQGRERGDCKGDDDGEPVGWIEPADTLEREVGQRTRTRKRHRNDEAADRKQRLHPRDAAPQDGHGQRMPEQSIVAVRVVNQHHIHGQ